MPGLHFGVSRHKSRRNQGMAPKCWRTDLCVGSQIVGVKDSHSSFWCHDDKDYCLSESILTELASDPSMGHLMSRMLMAFFLVQPLN